MNTPTYERQPEESAKAYEAFCLYRDMGAGRSVDAAWRSFQEKQGANRGQIGGKIGRAPTGWWRWSSEYQWVRRAEEWDAEQDRQKREEARQTRIAEVEAYRQRVVSEAQEIAEGALQLVRLGMDAISMTDISKIPPGALPAFIGQGMKAYNDATRLEGIGLGLVDEDGKLIGAD